MRSLTIGGRVNLLSVLAVAGLLLVTGLSLMKLDGVKGIVQNTTSKKQHARRAEVSGIAAE